MIRAIHEDKDLQICRKSPLGGFLRKINEILTKRCRFSIHPKKEQKRTKKLQKELNNMDFSLDQERDLILA